jgi:hypothetical protein
MYQVQVPDQRNYWQSLFFLTALCFPYGALLTKRLPLYICPSPRYRSLLSGFLSLSLYKRQRRSISENPFNVTYLAFKFLSKETSLQFRLGPVQRDGPFTVLMFLEASRIRMNPSPPSRFRNGAPMERDAHFQSLPLHISWSLQ